MINKVKKICMLDTNVVISLATYSQSKSIEKLMGDDGIDYYKAKSIATLYKLIEDGKVIAGIPLLVVEEINQGVKRFGDFVRNYVKQSPIIIASKMTGEQQDIVNNLVEVYLNYKTASGEYAFERHEEKHNGINDAIIMAVASVYGTDIITFDKHFTSKILTIKDCNKMFQQTYLRENKLEDKVSPRFGKVEALKPTVFIEYADDKKVE